MRKGQAALAINKIKQTLRVVRPLHLALLTQKLLRLLHQEAHCASTTPATVQCLVTGSLLLQQPTHLDHLGFAQCWLQHTRLHIVHNLRMPHTPHKHRTVKMCSCCMQSLLSVHMKQPVKLRSPSPNHSVLPPTRPMLVNLCQCAVLRPAA